VSPEKVVSNHNRKILLLLQDPESGKKNAAIESVRINNEETSIRDNISTKRSNIKLNINIVCNLIIHNKVRELI
jgi:hypothetical protein